MTAVAGWRWPGEWAASSGMRQLPSLSGDEATINLPRVCHSRTLFFLKKNLITSTVCCGYTEVRQLGGSITVPVAKFSCK